jgi:LmbE family N-acetylglucosaminyl deacetylase
MLSTKKAIVIAAHPDDEILGCGGTLLKYAAGGCELGWLIATNVSEEQGFSSEKVISRQKEINEVAARVPFKKVYKLDLPTMKLDETPSSKLIFEISKAFNDFKPDTVFVLNRSDAHSDHRVLFDAVMACTKTFRYPFIKKVLMYECLSETEFSPPLPEKVFIPNYFVDITEFLTQKLEIMKIYASEIGKHPFPRSLQNIEALAIVRGATAGVKYAESFCLLKNIE